jgi:hypothetical protein
MKRLVSNNKMQRIQDLLLCLVMVLVLAGCASQKTIQPGLVQIGIQVDGKQVEIQAPAGTSVQSVLDSAGILLNNLDRIDPASYTLVTGPISVRVVRIQEVFENEETVIPFTYQTVKNESLPEGQQLLVQPGANGLQQITYRRIIEDGIDASRTAVKTVMITEPKPEILMIGVQTPFTSIPITRKLAYLSGGNAWVMERSSGERKPLITTGDLDGRVFSISPDGKWLLFTRKSTKPAVEEINSLWVIQMTEENAKPIDLKARNIIHFAGWAPELPNTVYCSTVEPRSAAPGWQANNDLLSLTFSSSGGYVRQDELLQANSGGIYGWWGTSFEFSTDGKKIAFSRPDGVGLADLEKKSFNPLVNLLPYQARGDWAWVPGVSWSPDQRILYTVTHVRKAGLVSEESSPIFNLTAFIPETNLSVNLVEQSGMFAYPTASPMLPGKRYLVAFLQSIFPEKSDSSRYRLMVMEQDGSNRRVLFPPEGSAGMEPQQSIWSPLPDDNLPWLAVIYQGNLWLINPTSGENRQITGDGLISRVDWR